MAQATIDRESNRSLELLGSGVAGLGAASLSLEDVLELLRSEAGADACELFQVGGEELLLVAICGEDADAFSTVDRFDLGAGYPGVAAARGEVMSTTDLAHDALYLRDTVKARGYSAFASVPLLHGARVVGTVDFAWKDGDTDVEAALEECRLAISVLAVAIAAELTRLPHRGSVSKAVTLEHMASWFRTAGEADSATVFAARGDELFRGLAGKQEVTCACLSTGAATSCPRLEASSRCFVYDGPREDWPRACRTFPEEFETVIGVPLNEGDRLHAIIFVGYHRSPAPATKHCPTLLALARDVAPLFSRVTLPEVTSETSIEAVLEDRPALKIECLGGFKVTIDGVEVSADRFSRAKAVEAMKLLVMRRGRAVTRGELIDQLWPGAKPASGTRSLHVAIHALRGAIEPFKEEKRWTYVLRQGHGYRFDVDACEALDIRDFRKKLARAHTVESEMRPLGEVIEHFEAAVASYQGTLFADDADAEWCREEREAYRTQATDALVHLAYLAKLAELPERRFAALGRAVEIDPLREDIQQHLVRTLWAAGRRKDAHRQYEQFIRTLRDELGATPLPETLQLGEQIGLGDQSPQLRAGGRRR
jgi:DNA-binding SARP family transcriptional activator